MKAVGAHIYAGGFTQGVKDFFDVPLHIEEGKYGIETSMLNHGVQISHEFVLPAGVDFVYCNPPCAPWSQAGSKHLKNGTRDYTEGFDPRDDRVACMMRCFSLLGQGPKVLAIESVSQLWSKGRPMVEGLIREAARLGYASSVVLLNGFDTGLPQNRKRAFIIFHNVALPIQKPVPPPGSPRTVREAWAGLVDPEPVVQRHAESIGSILPVLVEGEKGVKVWERIHGPGPGAKKGRPSFLLHRLEWNRPSPTHLGASGTVFIHPTEDRFISVREAQVLCGYPQDYTFCGTTGKQYAQMAQAVLPPVGRWLAGQVHAALENPTPATQVNGPTVYDWLTRQA